MKITFDRSANAAYISLKDINRAEAVKQHTVDEPDIQGMVILDVDSTGRLIGIEVMNATRALPQEALDAAERI